MTLHARLSHYLAVTARYLAQPQTLAMRRPYFLPQVYSALCQPLLKTLNIATVLDIGAYVGGFS
jgi:hypothetical protein